MRQDQNHLVLVNQEDQYSIWPAGRELPPGWRADGFTGPEAECLDHIDEVWTDLRPLSLRGVAGSGEPVGPSLPELFAAQVARAPQAVAVVAGGRSLTYEQLDLRSNALARRLLDLGVQPDEPVAVAIERGPELIIALLGVLKAGGAYLPIDSGSPAPRVAAMLFAAQVRRVVTWGEEPVLPPQLAVVAVDESTSDGAGLPRVHPLSLAYISFTSGSTGVPKGVAVPQRAVVRLVSEPNFAELGPGQRVLHLAPVAFDASTLEIWGALLTGGTVVVAPPGQLSLAEIAEVLRGSELTVVWLTAGLFHQLADADPGALAEIPVLLSGGGVLDPDTTRAVLAARRGKPLVNGYGPTENTTFTTCQVMTDPGQVGETVPIGQPIQRTTVYLLDEHGNTVQSGQIGELCTGGEGVARGYIANAAATARAFVPDPFGVGERLYRTGDLARELPDGTFEFVGRVDDQVKIRGFRVEPGEVAAVLRRHPAVRDSVVVVDRPGSGDPRLIGYVAADAGAAELIDFAGSQLPGYLVPAAVVVLPALPLTANGKVDRAALPAPDRVAAGLAEVAAAQRTPTEGAVAGIISRLLGSLEVGADDDFFALGGTSLLAGRLVTQLAGELNASLSLHDLLDARTVAGIAAAVDERTGPQAVDAFPTEPVRPPVLPGRRDVPIPLSMQQERVWFFEQLSPGNLAYNFQASISLKGEVDVDVLRRALDEAVRRHEILRTAFVVVDGVPLQQPVARAAAPFRVADVPAEQAAEAIAEELRKPFDLTVPPLARWVLLRHGNGENTLVHIEHHLVHDGWSFAVLLSDLAEIYTAYLAGEPSPLPELAVQYADFALWQREWMQGEVLKEHIEHATELLAGAPQVLELPADRPRPAVQSLRGAAPRVTIPAELSRALRAFSREHRVSLFATMYAGFTALLHRYTGQRDLLVGTGAANRSLPELEPVVGMIVNTLVLRTRIAEQTRFTELIEQVQHNVADALAWSETPVDAVIDAIRPPRDTSRTPLFQIMFSFHDSAVPDLDFGGLHGAVTERSNGSAKSDLNVIVVPRAAQRLGRQPLPEDDDLNMIWEYSTDLFDADTMARMVEHYLNLLTDAVSRPATPIDQLRLLADAESRAIGRWSLGSQAAYPADASIPELFAAQAAKAPEATALVFGGRTLTYAELDRRSNALARCLLDRGVRPDEPVAVAVERGPELIVALLGVLKAGGAYLPIDSGSPAPRVAAMLSAARARHAVAFGGTSMLPPDLDILEVDESTSDGAGLPRVHPLSLAYISFTSGSTGVPKGVAVPQQAVIRLVSEPMFAKLGPGQRLLHLAPVAFDASTLEIWGALLTGAAVVVAPPGPLGLPDIAALLRDSGVTLAWLTAGLFHQLVETDVEALSTVEVLLSGGDVLNPDAVRTVLSARQGRSLVNGYGPTENTTFTTCHVMADLGAVGATVPIGQPIQHTTVHILDEQGQPAPIGVTGELLTGGDGLARGYAGNAAATARAFVPDPFRPGKRLYRTGDLARWRADGTIEFVGRRDDQVKIRGFRVEPGEVAEVLRGHPSVGEAVVVVSGSGAQKRLVGYVTPAEGVEVAALTPGLLREHLTGRLPEYLVPAAFKALDRLPLNPNGKIDRAALPAPDLQAREEATPPRGATEQRLAEVWRVMLPLEGGRDEGGIGREDGFFALGGNSLLAARLMFRIREVFGVDVRMAAFYEAPTLAACAAAIDAARAEQEADGKPRTAAPTAIGRRDRSAYRVSSTTATPMAAPGELPAHLARLTDDWSLWRTVCLRAAGFPLHLLDRIGDPALALAADAALATGAEEGFAEEFTAAVGRLSEALYDTAGLPELREAVAWQNRHALTTGIDPLIRRGPRPAKRNTQARQHESLVASYLQRYCAKNDTIGFFGPVSWSRIDDEAGIRIIPSPTGEPLAARVTYLEGWAIRAVMAGHTAALRPWLAPRRMPFIGVDAGPDGKGDTLRVPLAPPVALSHAEAAVLRACDGRRDARSIAQTVLADQATGLNGPTEVFTLLERLAEQRRVAWQVDIAPQDLRPELTMRALLGRVDDPGVREPAEKALDELVSARDKLARSGGDPDRVTEAMADLEATFTRLAGIPATRRAGELYAGRTLVYEECLRGDTVRLGADSFDGIREVLSQVLDSVRWYTVACGQLYARHFEEAYRQRAAALGSEVVPFADLWLIINDALFGQPPALIDPARQELRRRWSAVLDLPQGERRVHLRASDLRERVAEHFPAQPLPWRMALHQSPDLMLAGADAAAGGRFTWVLGEVHPSAITSRYASWIQFHEAPEAFRAAARQDLDQPTVWLASTAENGGTCTRMSNVLASPGDLRLVFAHDSCGYDPAATLVVGECDVVDSPAGLRVRRRDGSFETGLLEVVGDLISGGFGNSFDLVPQGVHTPRVTIDDLVVSRERWRMPAAEAAFADTADERTRYLQARSWAAGHGFPRHVFVRVTGERKPVHADLTSLASIDLISRMVRRSRRTAGEEATLTVVEMLPGPQDAWLADAAGQRYTAELRMVALDSKSRKG